MFIETRKLATGREMFVAMAFNILRAANKY
jgi:hypothetical protein